MQNLFHSTQTGRKSFSFLKRTHFRKITNWSFGHLNQNQVLFSDKFKSAKIKTFLTRSKNPIKIKDSESYKQVTIKLYGKGAKIRDEVLLFGKEIKTKSQFLVKEGQFIFSRIDARNGAFAIATEEIDGAIVTNDFPVYDIDRNLVDPNYFALFISTKQFADYFQGLSSGTTNRQRMNEADFLEMEIPLPSVKSKDSSAVTQEKLVADYNAQMSQADVFEAKAKDLENESETYLLKELGIKIQQTEKKIWKNFKFLQPASLKELSRWDVKTFTDNSSNPFYTEKFKLVNLVDYFELNPKTNINDYSTQTEISFIPMESVSDEYGEIIDSRLIEIKKSKGYTKFQNNDLIWAKITPCMQNGKSAIVDNLKNGLGCGSTEFYVFRAKTDDKWLIEFLYVLGRSKHLRQSAMSYFTGSAGQQRVSSGLFKTLEIPLPKVTIREKIVKHINTLKAQIKRLKDDAQDLRRRAKADFEAELFEM